MLTNRLLNGEHPPQHAEEMRALIERGQSEAAAGTEPDKRFTLTMEEGAVSIGNGVVYDGFTVNHTIPGPTRTPHPGRELKQSTYFARCHISVTRWDKPVTTT